MAINFLGVVVETAQIEGFLLGITITAPATFGFCQLYFVKAAKERSAEIRHDCEKDISELKARLSSAEKKIEDLTSQRFEDYERFSGR